MPNLGCLNATVVGKYIVTYEGRDNMSLNKITRVGMLK